MDVFPYLSDPLLCGSVCWSRDTSGSTSDSGNSARSGFFFDDVVLLASSHPKKRAGRKKFRETRHPVYRGVRRRNSGKWVCEMREPNKKSRIWLGTYPTEVMAARAHDVAAIALRGRSACLNFADSLWRLPVPASSDAKDIRKAATEAAEAFRPQESSGVSGELSNPEEETATMTERRFFMDEDETAKMPGREFFMDEEAIFAMPAFLANMAEGLMLPPPPPHCAGGDGYDEDGVEFHDDVSLWSYSI
ncbi:basic helix-loop-helix protein [Sarracenia purpurea var. burkii]